MQQLSVPFQIEPVTPQRFQFWASFVAQASTTTDISVVDHVFHALWFEVSISTFFSHGVQGENMLSCAWFDCIVASLGYALKGWQDAMVLLKSEPNAATVQWVQEVERTITALSATRERVARFILWSCEQQGVPLPESTAALITGRSW